MGTLLFGATRSGGVGTAASIDCLGRGMTLLRRARNAADILPPPVRVGAVENGVMEGLPVGADVEMLEAVAVVVAGAIAVVEEGCSGCWGGSLSISISSPDTVGLARDGGSATGPTLCELPGDASLGAPPAVAGVMGGTLCTEASATFGAVGSGAFTNGFEGGS